MSDYLLLGLLGHPLSHSLSPSLHAAALRYAGIEGKYLVFDVPPINFNDGFSNMLEQGVSGFNVTIPHKQRVYDSAEHLTPVAIQAGAVNTIKVSAEGKLFGHNTDVLGFELALKEVSGADLHGRSGLVIGAGGAARAAIVALNRLGLGTIKIKARDTTKSNALIIALQKSLAQSMPVQQGNHMIQLRQDDGQNYEQMSIVVNASPIGLTNDVFPEWLPALMDSLSNECLCFDMVYHKDMSSPVFSRLAQRRKLHALDGLPMLVHQARLAFEYWTEISVPYERMYKALGS
jgi:shikimate dehydrogenase